MYMPRLLPYLGWEKQKLEMEWTLVVHYKTYLGVKGKIEMMTKNQLTYTGLTHDMFHTLDNGLLYSQIYGVQHGVYFLLQETR